MRFSKLKYFGCRAYTLIEALVVVAIFTGFVVSSAGVFLMAYRAQAGSYKDELAEQSNMRGAFELEHLFRRAYGYAPLNFLGEDDLTLTRFNGIRLSVSNGNKGELENWVFQFEPFPEQDLEDRVKGSFSVYPPGTTGSYVYDEVYLPSGRDTFFELDDYGGIKYHWIVRGSYPEHSLEGITYPEHSWKGILVTSQ